MAFSIIFTNNHKILLNEANRDFRLSINNDRLLIEFILHLVSVYVALIIQKTNCEHPLSISWNMNKLSCIRDSLFDNKLFTIIQIDQGW